jgi:hypothetical protein
MKELFAGIVLILVVGVMGFLYRNVVENPKIFIPNSIANGTGAVCTDEAKVCPDGSAVGRTGLGCNFAACPFPNIEITIASSTIGFILPSGYTADATAPGSQPNLLAAYTKSSASATPNTITIREYPTSVGMSGEQIMLSNTTLLPTGTQATSTTAFKTVPIGSNTFYSITVQRSQGTVDTAYYLLRTNDVLRFDIAEANVSNGADSNLNPAILSEHQSLVQMLATLQSN